MGKSNKSPAKIKRSILRLLDYKQAYLEDCWNTEIMIDQENMKIIWNASDTLKLTLKKNIRIVETRNFYNPAFTALPFRQKLAKFQNMWMPDQQSFNFFSCMNEHFKRNSSKCDHFCGSLTSPFCGNLAYFISNNNWPIT